MTADEFDWGIFTQPSPLALVRGQLEFSWLELARRLATLTDADMLREPAPGAWTVRRRADARAPHVVGAGEWVAEWPDDDGSDNRTRTIAWLIAHLTEAFYERWEHTFGGHTGTRDDVEVFPTAAEAVAGLTRQVDAWRAGIAALDDDRVMTVGLSQASEIDRMAPFAHLVLHMNRELIHHGAEITALQDLYASTPER
jgi:hypothetical protein